MERAAGDHLPPPGADSRGPGDRGEHRRDGVRQPRLGLRHRRRVHPRPGERGAGHLRGLPAQRAGRGRRRRHPQHAAAGKARRAGQGVLRRAAGHHGPAGAALPRRVRHRVHHRARQAVDAADPGRQAVRAGRVRRRAAVRRRRPDRHRRGAAPGDRRSAGPADVPRLRPERGCEAAHEGRQRLTGRRQRQGGVRQCDRRRVGRARRARDPGAPGDQPGRPARDDRRPRHPDQPGRADQPRGGGRPRHGQDSGVRRRQAADRPQAPPAHRPGRRRGRGGRPDLHRRHHRGGVRRRGAGGALTGGQLPGGQARPVGPRHRRPGRCGAPAARTRRQHAAAAGTDERRHRARRGPGPTLRRRGDRAVPHRAHVPRRAPRARRAADPGRERGRADRRPGRPAPAAAQGLRGDLPGDARAAGDDPACWTRRCTSSCPT